MGPPESPSPVRALLRFSTAAAGISAFAATSVLVGWALDVPFLKSIAPSLDTMKANAALCFALAGASLWLAQERQEPGAAPLARRLSQVFAAIVVLVALLTLSQYLFGWDLGIDQLLFVDAGGALRAPPGRMSFPTSLALVLFGASLLLLHASRPGPSAAQLLALGGGAISSTALLGYAYSVASPFHLISLSGMPLYTSVASLVLCLGLLLARPEEGAVAVLVRSSPSRAMAPLLLGAVLVPGVLGWLFLEGHRAGYYRAEAGLAMTVGSTALVFLVLLYWSAGSLNRLEGQREQASTELSDERARLAGLVESAMDGIITVDEGHRIVLFNQAAEAMFGHAAGAMLGQPLDCLLPERFRGRHGEHIGNFGRTGTSTRRMGALGAISGLRANGQEFPIEASISQVEAGRQKFFTVILRDITERKRAEDALREAEEKLRLFVEHAPAAIAMLDRDLNYLASSKRWLSDYGLNDRRIIGQNHYEVFPDIPERWKEIHRRCLGGAVESNEADPWIRSDGRAEWVRWEIRPWRQSDGEIGGLLVFSEVVTQSRQREEELRRSHSELRALAVRLQSSQEAERARVARELHDELGQMLTCLKMEVAGLARGLRADQKALRKRTEEANRLLDASIIWGRRLATELRPGVLKVLGLAAAIEWKTNDFHSRSGVACSLSLPQEVLPVSDEQATALFRILQEALTNVARHSGAKNVEVQLAATDGRLVLEVRDDGRGISKAPAGSRSLGLVGMAERARLLGGRLEIGPRPGGGTLVRASIPLEPALPAVEDEWRAS